MLHRKLTIAAIAFALVVGFLAIGSFSADAARTAKYEYQLIGMRLQPRSITANGNKVVPMQSEFTHQGQEGWKYEGTIPGKDDAYFVVFSREK